MTKSVVFSCVVSLFIFALQSCCFSDNSPPAEVAKAAENGLAPLLDMIPQQKIAHFGFLNADEMAQAGLGNPLQVYVLRADSILGYKKGDELNNLLEPTDTWLFPVTCHGEAKCSLTVAFFKGKWRAVGIGGSEIAREIDQIKRRWPRSKGLNPVFIRVFAARAAFIALSGAGAEPALIPFRSGARAMSAGKKRAEAHISYTLPEVIPKLVSAVQRTSQISFPPEADPPVAEKFGSVRERLFRPER